MAQQNDGAIIIDLQLEQDEFEKRLNELETKTTNFGNKIKTGLKIAAAATATAFAAALKQAVGNYTQYEQLVGGVETLFKKSSDKVVTYANKAYKTAGMSANKYMETVTSFSASLLQGLGGDTKKAAEMADMAIIDMSDNANKMGTNIEMIQNAYQGFAKQNYTMLDNLKLGYGGTQTEMIRLINDSGILEKKITSLDGITFDQVVSAIHEVQTKMGITGTTALEAATTIEGSANSMKAAWENFLTGMADENADFDKLVQNLVDSIVTYIGNIGPRIIQTIPKLANGLAQVIGEIGSMISSVVPNEFKPLLEGLGTAVSMLTGGFIAFKSALMITALIGKVSAALSLLKVAFLTLSNLGIGGTIKMLMGFASPVTLVVAGIAALVAGFLYLWNTSEDFRNFWMNLWNAVSAVFTDVWTGIVEFFTVTIPETWNSFIEKLVELKDLIIQTFSDAWNGVVSFFTETIPAWIESIIEWFTKIPYNLGYLLGQAIGHVIQFGLDLWNFVTVDIPNFINGIIDWFSQLPGKIWEQLLSAWNYICQWGSDTYSTAKEWTSKTISNIVEFFKSLPGKIWTWLCNVVNKVVTWGSNLFSKGKEAAGKLVKSVVDGVASLPGKMLDIGKNIVDGIWKGISGAAGWLKNKIGEFADGIVGGIKDFFGIASPSKVMRDMIGKYLPPGIAVGFEMAMPKSIQNMNSEIDTMTNGLQRRIDMNMSDLSSSAYLEGNVKVTRNSDITNAFPKSVRMEGGQDVYLVTEDGTELAHWIAPYVDKELKFD